ncbi:hypothetical protein OIU83_17670 [Flavobacterium sp. LS1R49]|uniref:Transmembrane Fragile-X-F protein n=1 Tax=Flavobacterium shii TaxID=2987687 RepID=A0A9X2YWT5_9FLAO|nr:hypothetical protein [Flavobacterium shii]MCV9929494.1 hypothetical protein [Flavobacterium shii]
MSSNSTQQNGIGFGGILTIVFIILKLTKYIDWSWWWVLSPVLIPIAFVSVAFLIAVLITVIKK